MYVYICLNTVNPSLINVQNELRTDNETARASHAGFLFPLVADNVEQLKLIWQHVNTHVYIHIHTHGHTRTHTHTRYETMSWAITLATTTETETATATTAERGSNRCLIPRPGTGTFLCRSLPYCDWDWDCYSSWYGDWACDCTGPVCATVLGPCLCLALALALGLRLGLGRAPVCA